MDKAVPTSVWKQLMDGGNEKGIVDAMSIFSMSVETSQFVANFKIQLIHLINRHWNSIYVTGVRAKRNTFTNYPLQKLWFFDIYK